MEKVIARLIDNEDNSSNLCITLKSCIRNLSILTIGLFLSGTFRDVIVLSPKWLDLPAILNLKGFTLWLLAHLDQVL